MQPFEMTTDLGDLLKDSQARAHELAAQQQDLQVQARELKCRCADLDCRSADLDQREAWNASNRLSLVAFFFYLFRSPLEEKC